MKELLTGEHEAVLAALAAGRTLIAFDFDGTLAPIVLHRDAARMRPRTEQLLRQVCELYPCAVITGRSVRDVSSRLGRAQVKHVMGNHGLEPGERLGEFEREIAEARAFLARRLLGIAGVEVEDKQYSLALHYRRSATRRLASAAIRRSIDELPMRLRVVPGKEVINLVPWDAPDKGDALLSMRATEGAELSLYVGDDDTDEDVFQLDEPNEFVGVRVGESRASAASYFLHDQLQIDVLLARLVALRTRPSE